MALLFVDEDDTCKKINIDDLYENKQKRDLKQISIFNKILNRIQHRIVLTGRTKRNEHHTWFNIPEYIFGEPLYDKTECIAYVIYKLEENGFFIKYMHPNTLFISWDNWVPMYVRNELKKRKGIVIDEKGNLIKQLNENREDGDIVNNSSGVGLKNAEEPKKENRFTPINKYKPTGNLIYNPDLFEKLEKKFAF